MINDMTLFRRNMPKFSFGFDTLLNDLERWASLPTMPSKFPPYNVYRSGDNQYTLEMAVAGYGPDEISVVHDKASKTLEITGTKEDEYEDATREYRYRGLSARNFKTPFFIGENYEIQNANLVDGMLTITIEKVVPEELKPKQIEITTTPLLEGKTSNKKKLKAA